MNFSLAWRDCWQELQITRLSQAFSGAALKLVHMKRILASVKRSGVKQSWYLFSFFPSVKHQYTKCNASSQPVVSKALTVKLRWVPWLGTQTRDSKWIANQCYLNVEISRSMIQVDPDFRIYLLPKCRIFHFVAFRYVFKYPSVSLNVSMRVRRKLEKKCLFFKWEGLSRVPENKNSVYQWEIFFWFPSAFNPCLISVSDN